MPAKNILDEDIWQKAKKAAGKGNEKNYDMISHIYKKMGGKYSQKTVKKSTDKLATLLKAKKNESPAKPVTMKLRDLLKAEKPKQLSEMDRLRDILKAKKKEPIVKDPPATKVDVEASNPAPAQEIKKAATIPSWQVNLMKVDNRG